MLNVQFYKEELYMVEILEGESKVGYIEFETLNGVVHIEYSWIERKYQGKGYSKELYKAFSQVYMEHFHTEYPYIGRCFVNQKAYKTARRMIDEGYLPKSTWNDEYVDCDF